MRRIHFFLFTIVAAMLSFVSCEKDRDGNKLGITFSDTCDMTPVFEASGGERSYTFRTDCDWLIETFDDWVSVTPDRGSSPYGLSFTLKVAAHDGGEQRESHIIMHLSNGNAVKIPIVQKMRERFDVDAKETYTISESGGTLSVDVETNMEYTVFIPKGIDWIEHSIETRTMRNEQLCFDIRPNSAHSSRSATIFVRANDYESTLLHSFIIIQSAEGEALNEITYTTINDRPIEQTIVADFGARFVAHHWENGVGRIIFENDVTIIPREAFYNQNDIKSITLPAGVTKINDRAFVGCTSIETFTLPANVEQMGSAVFEGCEFELNANCAIPKQIEIVDDPNKPGQKINRGIPATDARHWLYGSTIPSITFNNRIGEYGIYGYTALESVTFTDGVKTIDNDAFAECSNIKVVTAPSLEHWCSINFDDAEANPIANDGAELMIGGSAVVALDTKNTNITTIGKYAFARYELDSIVIDDKITSIGWGAFEGCNVDFITLGNGINSIGSYAFNETTTESLTIDFDIPDMQKDAAHGNHWFYGLTTQYVTFGNNVKSIGIYAISNLSGVKEVVIGDSVEEIYEGAFANCANLTSIEIGKGMKCIGKNAFYNCPALTDVALSDGVTTIGISAFSGCSSIESFDIPASVTVIDDYAFNNCTSLANIYCHPTTPPTLGDYAIKYPTIVHVPATSYNDYIEAEKWKSIKDRVVGDM